MKTFKTMAILLLANLLGLCLQAQNGSGQIKGYIVDDEQNPVLGALVKITQNGTLVGGTVTDEEGKYVYKPLTPGYYEVNVSSSTMEFPVNIRNNVEVEPERTAYVDFKVVRNGADNEVVVVAEYVKPIVDQSVYTMKSLDAQQFLHMPGDRGDIKGAIVNIASEVSEDADGELHIRGSRGDATEYIVDGVRTPNMGGIPALSVENVSVITGGIPAQYGDLVSGVVVVTTKDYFSGIREKRMRENYFHEKEARIKREKEAKIAEEKRLKEIEEEKLKEEQQAKPQN